MLLYRGPRPPRADFDAGWPCFVIDKVNPKHRNFSFSHSDERFMKMLLWTVRVPRSCTVSLISVCASALALCLPMFSSRAADTAETRYDLTRSLATRAIPPQSLSSTGVLNNGRVLIPLSPEARNLSIMVRRGSTFAPAAGAVTNVNNAPHLLVETNKIYLLRSPKVARPPLKLSTKAAFLPDELAMYLSEKESVHAAVYLYQYKAMRCYPTGYQATIFVGVACTNSVDFARRLLADPLPVKFSSGHIDLKPGLIEITKPGITGEATIEATSPRYYKDDPITARWGWGGEMQDTQLLLEVEKLGFLGSVALLCPPILLAATIIGGLLGSIGRIAQSGNKQRRQWVWLIAGGLVTALFLLCLLILGLLPAVGITLTLPLAVPSALLLGLIGGFGGTRLLEKWVGKLTGDRAPGARKSAEPVGIRQSR